MCGIVGTYNFKRTTGEQQFILACLKTMHHRGPDAQGYWDNGKNYFAGFARLAIRDLSENGNQPMLTACGNYCISFNGEIYNTGALQNLLKPFSINFKSTSDTEVLLYALQHLGVDKTLAVADGIFAFAFFDVRQNKLLLARDRVGVKPLYIGQHENGIVYSSQYDHIINYSYCNNNSLSGAYIGAYLQLGYVPEDGGIKEKTKMLLHGHYYIIHEKGIEQHCYYNYGNNNKTIDKAAMENVIENAVKSQLISDVPVGTFMSGGTDSTLVTSLASKQQVIQSFTIGVNDENMNEALAAAEFAKIFKTNHDCRYIDKAIFLNTIKEHFKAFSEPFADYSSLPTLMLSAFAKEKVTVALSGDGGDELFWGYPRNRKVLQLFPFYEKGLFTRRMQLLLSKMKKNGITDVSRHWNVEDLSEYYYSSLFITGANQCLKEILEPEPAHAYHYSLLKNRKEVLDRTSIMEMVRKLEVDIHLQRILLKVDRASMYHSLEVRVPLLNNEMLDVSEAFSYADCVEGEYGKINLKRLLASKTSDKLVFTPKKGFTIPIDNWLRNILKDEVTEKIMDMPSHLSIFFNRKKLQHFLQQYLAGQNGAGWLVWAIYVLVQWDMEHNNKKN